MASLNESKAEKGKVHMFCKMWRWLAQDPFTSGVLAVWSALSLFAITKC